MKVIRPIVATDAVLLGSSVPENDYPEWASGTTYNLGARVISTATHRAYESAANGNVGQNPDGGTDWIDLGATNRWAMFDTSAGVPTSAVGHITVSLAPGVAIDALGLLDVSAASIRIQVVSGSVTVHDETRSVIGGRTAFGFKDLGADAAAQVIVTVSGADGTAPVAVGKLVIGTMVDLGITETAVTVGITDYSKRATDDFGVTTVVQRGWAKTLGVKTKIDTGDVSEIQQRLADLRGTASLWIGDEDYDSLAVLGFFKDFSIDLALPTVSYCTLTIEGLPSTDAGDLGESDAPRDDALMVIRPALVDDAVLTGSSVDEDDFAQWSAAASYGVGQKAIRTATHRIYENVTGINSATAPEDDGVNWIDIASTNRWAMFDQALGSATTSTNGIVVTLTPGVAIGALALLDVVAASVRVETLGYNQSQILGDKTSAPFLDLDVPAGQAITVTVLPATPGQSVSVGTLIMGPVNVVGTLETSPTVGITDFSKKDTDDFGNTTVVQRAWAKRVSARALVFPEAVDVTVRRMAAVRAKPCLWIGQSDIDALTIYGFFKDFSLEVSETTSIATLTIEGLSTAAPVPDVPTAASIVFKNTPVQPLQPTDGTGPVPAGWTAWPQALAVGEYRWWSQAQFLGNAQQSSWTVPVKVSGTSWVDVIDDDPTSPKPEDGATVGAPEGTPVAGSTAEQVVQDLGLNGQNWFDLSGLTASRDAIMLARTTLDGVPIGTVVSQLRSDFQDETSATAESLSLLGAKAGDGLSWLLDQSTVRVGPADGGAGPTQTLGQRFQSINVSLGSHTGSINNLQSILIDPQDGVTAKGVLAFDIDGRMTGVVATATGLKSTLDMVFDAYNLLAPDGTVLLFAEAGVVKMPNVEVNTLKVNTAVVPVRVAATDGINGHSSAGGSPEAITTYQTILTASVTLPVTGWIEVTAQVRQKFFGPIQSVAWRHWLYVDGVQLPESEQAGAVPGDNVTLLGSVMKPAGTYVVQLRGDCDTTAGMFNRSMFIKGYPATE